MLYRIKKDYIEDGPSEHVLLMCGDLIITEWLGDSRNELDLRAKLVRDLAQLHEASEAWVVQFESGKIVDGKITPFKFENLKCPSVEILICQHEDLDGNKSLTMFKVNSAEDPADITFEQIEVLPEFVPHDLDVLRKAKYKRYPA